MKINKYTIGVLVKSLFRGRTASWVRIVNDVDKYVTESMLTEEEEDTAPRKPLPKQDQDRSLQQR